MLRERARRLRRDQTSAERRLWARLRDRQVAGAKFRVDFCCPERMLVIELDGGHHASEVEADRRRPAFLVQRDNEAMTQTDAVMQRILPSPPKGKGVGERAG
jgi:very-short-patch-repair endonuclease